ncbi:MAG: geranylgeranyl diphosphate synthase, type [Thermosipho sp. (in: thermotogales)]|nr:geranylgeranyl diphosphate synthase, type [Thermosipho sp. (in: thermotogales)]MDN5324904.1 geranylgeranyl diphosphate synthase, type [Thermosipho sp. (in: thermotogales)]
MNFKEFKNFHLEKINSKIQQIFDEQLSDVDKEFEYLISEAKSFTLRPGKRIRPLLFILGFEAYKEKSVISNEDLYLIAASLEIMHAFLLIHDDIMDRATLRRGKPTLHVILNEKYSKIVNNEKIGEDLSIILGDLLMFYVLKTLSKIKIPNLSQFLDSFSECYIKTAYGQLLDSLNSSRKEYPSKNTSFKIAELKTAYYSFYFPFYLGYLISNSNKKGEEEKIKNAFIPAGIAFQIRDDIVSTFDEKSGKTLTSDLQEGKFTSLIDLGNFGEDFYNLLKKKNKSDEELNILLDNIKSSGVLEKAIEKMNVLFEKSIANIDSLSISDEHKFLLKDFIKSLR